MLFDALKEIASHAERFFVTRYPGIFAQPIDSETDGIELLLRVLRISLIVKTPIDAAVFMVDKVLQDIVFGPTGYLQVFWFAQHTIGSGEGPQDACIEDGSLVGMGMQMAAAIDASIEAAALMVNHTVEPEAEDIVLEHLAHLVSELFYFLSHCLFFCRNTSRTILPHGFSRSSAHGPSEVALGRSMEHVSSLSLSDQHAQLI